MAMTRTLGADKLPTGWHEGHSARALSALIYYAEVNLATLGELTALKSSSNARISRQHDIVEGMIKILREVHATPEIAWRLNCFRIAEELQAAPLEVENGVS